MKTIQLFRRDGLAIAHTIVDDEDYDFLMQWGWKLKDGEAQRKEGANQIYMRNVVARRAGMDMSKEIIHFIRDPLDNRRHNLRSKHNPEKGDRLPHHRVDGVIWSNRRQMWKVAGGHPVHIEYYTNLDRANAAVATLRAEKEEEERARIEATQHCYFDWEIDWRHDLPAKPDPLHFTTVEWDCDKQMGRAEVPLHGHLTLVDFFHSRKPDTTRLEHAVCVLQKAQEKHFPDSDPPETEAEHWEKVGRDTQKYFDRRHEVKTELPDGTGFDSARGWYARLEIEANQLFFGYFSTWEEAVAARKDALQQVKAEAPNTD